MGTGKQDRMPRTERLAKGPVVEPNEQEGKDRGISMDLPGFARTDEE